MKGEKTPEIFESIRSVLIQKSKFSAVYTVKNGKYSKTFRTNFVSKSSGSSSPSSITLTCTVYSYYFVQRLYLDYWIPKKEMLCIFETSVPLYRWTWHKHTRRLESPVRISLANVQKIFCCSPYALYVFVCNFLEQGNFDAQSFHRRRSNGVIQSYCRIPWCLTSLFPLTQKYVFRSE